MSEPRPPEAKTAGGQDRRRPKVSNKKKTSENFIEIKNEKKLVALRHGRKATRFFSFLISMKISTTSEKLARPRPQPRPKLRPCPSRSVTQSPRRTNFIPQGDHSFDGGGARFINQKWGLQQPSDPNRDEFARSDPIYDASAIGLR